MAGWLTAHPSLCFELGRGVEEPWFFCVANERWRGVAGKHYLLELKLSAPTDISIGIERCGDAASDGIGIHLGRRWGGREGEPTQRVRVKGGMLLNARWRVVEGTA